MSQLGSDVGIAMTRNFKLVRRRGLEPPRSLPPLEPESISNCLFSRETRIVNSQKTPQKTSDDYPFRDRRSLVGIDQSTDEGSHDDCASPSSGPAPQASETLGRAHQITTVQHSGAASAHWSTGERAAFICALESWIASPSSLGEERTREAITPYFADRSTVQSTGGVQ